MEETASLSLMLVLEQIIIGGQIRNHIVPDGVPERSLYHPDMSNFLNATLLFWCNNVCMPLYEKR